jgi:8-oxo-dGTP pyrophosphatase MutT (NUDIX family)
VSWQRIRPLVLGVPRRDGDVFVAEYSGANERFYRPIGGGVEFGEYSDDALRREFREELDLSVAVGRHLGVVENTFTFEGTPGHEVVFVYEIEETDDLWNTSRLDGQDDDGTYVATWQSLSALESGGPPLYPDGLRRLLTEDTTHVVPRD